MVLKSNEYFKLLVFFFKVNSCQAKSDHNNLEFRLDQITDYMIKNS